MTQITQADISPFEIQDTGMEDIGGSVVYNKIGTDWTNLGGSTLTPNIDYITDSYQAQKKDRVNQKWEFIGNRVQSKNAINFTLTCAFSKDRLTDYENVLRMGDSFGLKKIRGGQALIEIMANIQGVPDGELYVIIRSIRPSEGINRLGALGLSITFEVV